MIKKNNNYTLPCNYKLTSGSAQVKSAILLASLGAAGKTTILEKIGSRDHTEIMLKYLGAKININSEKISLESPNFLKPKDIHIPGDFSSASFLIVAGLIIFQSKIIINMYQICHGTVCTMVLLVYGFGAEVGKN